MDKTTWFAGVAVLLPVIFAVATVVTARTALRLSRSRSTVQAHVESLGRQGATVEYEIEGTQYRADVAGSDLVVGQVVVLRYLPETPGNACRTDGLDVWIRPAICAFVTIFTGISVCRSLFGF
jgi:hypothetical protein